MTTIVLTLMEALVTLYPAGPNGAPITSNPIWMGVDADNLTVAERWKVVETRPTGAKYRVKHPLVQDWEINIARVWALDVQNLNGYQTDGGQYVMDVIWTDQDGGQWHRETFYGVTISGDHDRASRGVDGGYTENQRFEAQYMIPASGGGTPPAINPNLPYYVQYVGASGPPGIVVQKGPQLPIVLYNYDPNTSAFTLASPGANTNTATLTNSGTDFNITFANAALPALDVDNSGIVEAQAFISGAPPDSDLPRVEFMYGSTRLASISAAGNFYASQFIETNPDTLRTPAFHIKIGSNILMSLESSAAYAPQWLTFVPSSIPGLVLWCPIESLAGAANGDQVESWPDWSGRGNALAQATQASQPEYLQSQSQDPISGRPMPDTKPSVFFLVPGGGSSLATASNDVVLFNPGPSQPTTNGFVAFMFCWPTTTSLDDYEMDMFGSPVTGDDDFDFGIAGTPVGTFQGGNIGGGVCSPFNWHLVEFEVTNLGHVGITVDGVEQCHADGVTGDGAQKGVGIGTALGVSMESFQGYVRALLVYTGTLTTDQKNQIRAYLHALYDP